MALVNTYSPFWHLLQEFQQYIVQKFEIRLLKITTSETQAHTV